MAEKANLKTEKPRQASPKDVIAHLAKVIAACLIMMWGVINIVHNGLGFQAFDGESTSWWVTGLGVLLTGGVPFFLGIWMLLRKAGRS